MSIGSTEVMRFPEESPYGKYLIKDLGYFYAVSMTAGVARVIIRCHINRSLHLEDALMIACMGFYTAYIGCVAVYLEKGTNLMNTAEDFIMQINHDEKLRVIGSKASVASWYLYCFVIWGCKFTWWIVLRKFAITHGRRSRAIAAAGWFLLATFLASVITLSTICTPFTDYWKINPLPAKRECHDSYRTMLIVGSLNIASDIPLLVTPIPYVMKLQMPLRKKLGLYFLFGLGLCVIAAAFGRMAEVTSLRCLGSSTFWALIETTIAFVISNIPGIQSLWRHASWKRQLKMDAERRKMFAAKRAAQPFQDGHLETLESPHRRQTLSPDHSILYSEGGQEGGIILSTELHKSKQFSSLTIIPSVETTKISPQDIDTFSNSSEELCHNGSVSSAAGTIIDYGSIHYPDSLQTRQQSVSGSSSSGDYTSEISDLGEAVRHSVDLEQGYGSSLASEQIRPSLSSSLSFEQGNRSTLDLGDEYGSSVNEYGSSLNEEYETYLNEEYGSSVDLEQGHTSPNQEQGNASPIDLEQSHSATSI